MASVETDPIGAPLHAVALLARLLGEVEVDSSHSLALRRHRAALRRLAATAAMAAAHVHGAFGDRPDVGRALARVRADVRGRVGEATPPMRALGAVADAALALPDADADGHEDWQLGAIAFVDETLLRALYDACVALSAAAVREAAGV